MIDIETLGTEANSIVVSIGAVFFDIKNKQLGKEFYAVLDRKDQLKKGRTINTDTVDWWLERDAAARQVFKEPKTDVISALRDFTEFVRNNASEEPHAWGNGAGFDLPIMVSLYQTYGMTAPWKFFNDMDVRTVRRFQGKNTKIEKLGINHNALHDAKSQAYYVIQKLNPGKK